MYFEHLNPSTSEVLNTIWARSEGENIFMPSITGSLWTEGPGISPWEQEVGPTIAASRTNTTDYYFTPLRYNGARRRENVGKCGVIFADLDGNHLNDPSLPPSVVIETSEGHYHAYWFLDKPYDPTEWEKRAKAWSQRLSADPGGWDLTQVLRVPGTKNNKPLRGNTVAVKLFRPDRVYFLSDFPTTSTIAVSEVGEPPHSDRPRRDELIRSGLSDGTLPLTARYWLTVTPEELEALGNIDRSSIMWQVERQLISTGYALDDVYHLMAHSAINKWAHKPEKLWYEINKAAVS